MNLKSKSLRILLYITLVFSAVIFLMPIVWGIVSSFRTHENIFEYVSPLGWKTFLPVSPTLENYFSIFERFPLHFFLGNSVLMAFTSVVVGLFLGGLAAYSLARFDYPGKNLFFLIVILSLLMPFKVLVIPLYILVDSFGWVDTYQGLIFPVIMDGMTIFILRQFFIEIPDSLEEAAIIDGASHFQIFFRIMLPLAKPAFITAGLLQFIRVWNTFFWPLVITNSNEMTVFQVGLSFYQNEFQPAWGDLLAASTVGMVPLLIIFLLLQRYYIKGIALSGMKT